MKHDIPLLHNNAEIYIIHVEIIFSQNMQNNIRQLMKWDIFPTNILISRESTCAD